jgi:Alginate lyase
VLDGLKNGQAYVVTVTANNEAGSSAPVAVAVTPTATPPPPQVAPPATPTLDGATLAANRHAVATGDGHLQAELATLLAAANQDLTAGPWSVMDKTQVPPSGDRHDYLSQAPFWWPNPAGDANGCPYVQKDGQRNPAADAIPDHNERGVAWAAIYQLALAWFYTGDARYARRAELDLRTWFLDPATRMNPNLNFAQIIPCPGQPHTGIGIIESSEALGQVIDAAAVLDSGAPGWTAADTAGMRSWLGQFQTWLSTSPEGQAEAKAKNNHGSFFDAQAAAIATYLGQADVARAVVTDAETKRIATQVSADGSQPLEMARTRPWHYSNFNLEALCRLAAIGQHAGVNLWTYQAPAGGSMPKAVDFLLPGAVQGQSGFPKPELGTFDRSEAFAAAHAAAERGNANDAAARSALPSIPAPAGGDTWDLLPAC